jgi:hypothetical protein
MATTSTDRLIQLEDILDPDLMSHPPEGWPLYGLRLKKSRGLMPLYNDQLRKTNNNTEGHYKVYLRDSTMPERWHFSENPRIAPLWLVPETGWAIVQKGDFDVADAKAKGAVYRPKGLHGYDNENALMRAIFVGHGPAFKPKKGSKGNKIDVFQNTEVYNIVCGTLGIKPEENNGTLSLPLQAIGTHQPPMAATIPEDPFAARISSAEAASAAVAATESASTAAPTDATPTKKIGVDIDVPIPPKPEKDAGETDEEAALELTAWQKMKAKLMKIKAWLAWKLGAGPKPEGDPNDLRR